MLLLVACYMYKVTSLKSKFCSFEKISALGKTVQVFCTSVIKVGSSVMQWTMLCNLQSLYGKVFLF